MFNVILSLFTIGPSTATPIIGSLIPMVKDPTKFWDEQIGTAAVVLWCLDWQLTNFWSTVAIRFIGGIGYKSAYWALHHHITFWVRLCNWSIILSVLCYRRSSQWFSKRPSIQLWNSLLSRTENLLLIRRKEKVLFLPFGMYSFSYFKNWLTLLKRLFLDLF